MSHVYEFWAGDRPLYVGRTRRLLARLAEHARSSEWFDEVTDIRTERMPSWDAAHAVESQRIFELQPEHNAQGKADTWFPTYDEDDEPPSAIQRKRDALALLRAQNAQPVTPKHSAGARRAGERHTAAARVDGSRVAAPGGLA